MLFVPPEWVTEIMQLTFLSRGFAIFLLLLAIGGFAVSWIAERRFFPSLARILGHISPYLKPHHRKQRRRHKVLREEMWR